MTTHLIKCWPEYFIQFKVGLKTFELRKNDRDYAIGDTLIIQEYKPPIGPLAEGKLTGESLVRVVSHLLAGPAFNGALAEGWCIMSLKHA